jgi:hypothetical protein
VSLYAVEVYVRGLLDGLASPSLPTVQAWVLPPPEVKPGENPQAFVWGGSLDERRATLPRGSGQRRTVNNVDIYLQWIGDPLDGSSFPLLIDAVRTALRTVQLPVALTDPYTGEASSLTDLAETIRIDHGKPIAMAEAGGSLLQHVAKVTVPAAEWVGGT